MNSKDQTQRKDAGKPRYDLISPVATEDLARVLEFGAHKYAENGWRSNPQDWTRTIRSAFSHLNAIARGDDMDVDSGLPHAACLMANAMILDEYLRLGLGRDDRYRTAPGTKAPAPVVLLDRTPKPAPQDSPQPHRHIRRKTYQSLAYKSPVPGRGPARDGDGNPIPILKDADVLLKLVDGRTALQLAHDFKVSYSTGKLAINRLLAQGYVLKREYVRRPKGVPGRGSFRYIWEG